MSLSIANMIEIKNVKSVFILIYILWKLNNWKIESSRKTIILRNWVCLIRIMTENTNLNNFYGIEKGERKCSENYKRYLTEIVVIFEKFMCNITLHFLRFKQIVWWKTSNVVTNRKIKVFFENLSVRYFPINRDPSVIIKEQIPGVSSHSEKRSFELFKVTMRNILME